MENNKMSAEEVIKLISGRIIDEYRKHSSNIEEWPRIAAKKIHSQWFEFYQNETQSLQKQIEERDEEFQNLKNKFVED